MDSQKNFQYFIEGGIAAGKSTVLKMLSSKIPNCEVHLENIQFWSEYSGINHLKEFYNSPSKDSLFNLQSVILLSMMDRYVRHGQKGSENVIFERSARASRVFLSLNKELLTPLHFNILDDMARNIEKLCERDSHTVYLSLGEQEMIRRWTIRAREEERPADAEYLVAVKRTMDQEFMNDPNVSVVNTEDKSPEEIAREIVQILKTRQI